MSSGDVYLRVHRKLCLIAQGWWILLLGLWIREVVVALQMTKIV